MTAERPPGGALLSPESVVAVEDAIAALPACRQEPLRGALALIVARWAPDRTIADQEDAEQALIPLLHGDDPAALVATALARLMYRDEAQALAILRRVAERRP